MAGTDPNTKIANGKLEEQTFTLTYPASLGHTRMSLNFSRFSAAAALGTAPTPVSGKSISLPIPTMLTDETSLNVDGVELGLTGALAGEFLNSKGFLKGGLSGALNLGEAAAKYIQDFGNFSERTDGSSGIVTKGELSNYKVFANLVGKGSLSGIDAGIGAAADLQSGSTVNPFTSVKFDGVKLKSHTFEWTLSPKTRAESDIVRNIIRLIKAQVLPRYKGAGGIQSGVLSQALLEYPSLVNVALSGIDNGHYYNFPKPCIVQNFNVVYNEGDRLRVFEGGKPVIVKMSLQLLETQIHTANDFDEGTLLGGGGR